MFTVRLTNFGFSLLKNFATLEDAKAAARSTGFESEVYQHKSLIWSWSPISGGFDYTEY